MRVFSSRNFLNVYWLLLMTRLETFFSPEGQNTCETRDQRDKDTEHMWHTSSTPVEAGTLLLTARQAVKVC